MKQYFTLIISITIVAGFYTGCHEANHDKSTQESSCITPGFVKCGESCVDPATSIQFCGANENCEHYEICGSEQICHAGHCTDNPQEDDTCKTEGFVKCGDTCIDPRTSNHYCGANENCENYEVCKAADSCFEGRCRPTKCETDEHHYDVICEKDSVDHCGDHGIKCADQIEGWKSGDCIDKACIPSSCTVGYHPFGSSCEPDEVNHCGSHETDCSIEIPGWSDGTCEHGTCHVSACQNGLHLYENACEIDDLDNCGTHGISCSLTVNGWTSGKCINATCIVSECAESMHVYDNACESDTVENCGVHERACANIVAGWKSGACTQGACKLLQCINGFHIDAESGECAQDTNACCGASCIKCTGELVCSDGQCRTQCQNDEIYCNSECTNLKTSLMNCGECGRDCNSEKPANAKTMSCANSSCNVIDCEKDYHIELQDDKRVCRADTETACGSEATDCTANTLWDGVSCIDGKCIPSACKGDYHLAQNESGENWCEPNNDLNCGSHGNACTGGKTCVFGECSPDAMCKYLNLGIFEATIQCEWTPSAEDPYANHKRVSTPIVIDTPHDSGQANEILFVTGTISTSDPGVIRIIDGEKCALRETIVSDVISSTATPAAADVDGDGFVEIFASIQSGTRHGIGAWHWDSGLSKYKLWWTSYGEYSSSVVGGSIAIHDINHDGQPEIIGYGGEVFDASTGTRLNEGQTINELSYTPTLGDFDSDGIIEIIGTSNIYRWDSGTNRWVVKYPNIHSGVGIHHAFADFGKPKENGTFDFTTLDGIAEIVSCGNQNVNISTLSGETVFKQTISDTGSAPCAIGDFEGDGLPEIATAFKDSYRIFDPRCRETDPECTDEGVLWAQKTQTASILYGGSSLFDFDGDGVTEAVYADACYTRIYDGRTGEVLFSSSHANPSWFGYPVIADVDNDESPEIVVGSSIVMSTCESPDPIHHGLHCSNDDDCLSRSCVDGLCRCHSDSECNLVNPANGSRFDEYVCTDGITAADQAEGKVCRAKHDLKGSTASIRVLRDRLDRWTSSRNIWNQHAYSITNIYDNQTIPATSAWAQNFVTSGLNNFRQNAQGPRATGAAPDIKVYATENSCRISGSELSLGATICNRGTKMAASQMPVSFYLLHEDDSRERLCTAYTPVNVPDAACLDVSCHIAEETRDMIMHKPLLIIANDDGDDGRTTVECNEANNTADTVVHACSAY